MKIILITSKDGLLLNARYSYQTHKSAVGTHKAHKLLHSLTCDKDAWIFSSFHLGLDVV